MQTSIHRSIKLCEHAGDYYFPFYKWRRVPDVKRIRRICSFDYASRRNIFSKIKKRDCTIYVRVRLEWGKHVSRSCYFRTPRLRIFEIVRTPKFDYPVDPVDHDGIPARHMSVPVRRDYYTSNRLPAPNVPENKQMSNTRRPTRVAAPTCFSKPKIRYSPRDITGLRCETRIRFVYEIVFVFTHTQSFFLFSLTSLLISRHLLDRYYSVLYVCSIHTHTHIINYKVDE